MSISRAVPSWRLAFAAILLLVVPTTVPAAEPKSSVESLLTPETVGFLHVRIDDLWDSPGFAFYRRLLNSLGEADLKAFDNKFAPSPSQFESLTIIMPSMNVHSPFPDGRPVGESMLWVIATKKAIERGDLVKAMGLETRTKAHRGTDYLFDEEHWAGIVQVDPTTLVIGTEDSIIKLIEQRERAKGKESMLARTFAQEASRHSAMLALNPSMLATKDFVMDLPKELVKDVLPLLKASSAWLALDMKKESRLSLSIEFANAEQTAAGKKGFEAIRKYFLDLIVKGLKETQADEARATKRLLMGPLDLPAFLTPLAAKAALRYVETALKGLPLEATETSLRTSLNLTEFFPAHGDAIAIFAFVGLTERSGGSYYGSYRGYDREEIPHYLRDQFERVAAALAAYHADKGNFPPVAIYDQQGKPLLSWRVLILPYMEQRPWENRNFGPGPGPPFKVPMDPPVKQTYANLYKQFKLEEPWDSLNNKKLLQQMPSPFRVEFSANNWRQRADWKTGLQVFTGPGTMFPGRDAISKGQVRDGLDTTIAVVFRDDAQHAVPWTKPLDIPFGPKKQMPKLLNLPPEFRASGPNPSPSQGIFAIMGDGKSRRFPLDFDEKQFRGLITIDGGESVKLPEWKDPYPQPKFGPPPFPK